MIFPRSGCRNSGISRVHHFAGFITGLVMMALTLAAVIVGWLMPAGAVLAFSSRDEFISEIYLMDVPLGISQRLTHLNSLSYNPAWSPDGTHIVFESAAVNPDIYMVDLDGRNLERLTRDRSSDFGPAWSPDGGQIAFSSNRVDDAEIYVMEIDCVRGLRRCRDHTRRLTFTTGNDLSPAWSLDGTHILFHSGRNHISEIYLMDADGKDLQRVAAGSAPIWSPDGMQIAFVSSRSGDPKIYAINVDCLNRVLSCDETARQLTTIPGATPAWSPDGKQIAFGSAQNGHTEIYMMDSDGQNLYRLTRSPAHIHNSHPAWQP